MRRKPEEVPASRIPAGTLRTAAHGEGAAVVVNKARLQRGRLKIIRNLGQPFVPHQSRFLVEAGATSQSGERVVLRVRDLHKGAVGEHFLVSLKNGVRTPIDDGFSRDFFRLAFTGFSSDERFLACNWWVQQIAPRLSVQQPEFTYGGSGIYDTQSRQVWQQDGALLAVWSRSGQHLVFLRHAPGGVYLSRDRKEGGRRYQSFLDRSPAERLRDVHFFAKNARRLDVRGADRISFEQAVRLVGPWYRPLVGYSLKEEFNTYQGRDLEPNQTAPGNRGILLRNQFNTYWAEPLARLQQYQLQYLGSPLSSAIYKPTPPLWPMLSWSRDGERVYGMTGTSTYNFLPDRHLKDDELGEDYRALMCFWVRTGRFARVLLPDTLGTPLGYFED